MVMLFSFSVSIKRIWGKKLLSFQQCIQVSALQKMSERNLMFIRFMITQKVVLLMRLILFFLINLHASNLPDGWWMSYIFAWHHSNEFNLPNFQNLMLSEHLNLLFVSERSFFFQPYSVALKIITVSTVLPCRKSKEYLVSQISIVLSEM